MNTIEDFAALVRDELGLPVETEDLASDLDTVVGWDSVHLLSLCTILERVTGKPISLPAVLEAPNLAGIYAVAVGA